MALASARFPPSCSGPVQVRLGAPGAHRAPSWRAEAALTFRELTVEWGRVMTQTYQAVMGRWS